MGIRPLDLNVEIAGCWRMLKRCDGRLVPVYLPLFLKSLLKSFFHILSALWLFWEFQCQEQDHVWRWEKHYLDPQCTETWVKSDLKRSPVQQSNFWCIQHNDQLLFLSLIRVLFFSEVQLQQRHFYPNWSFFSSRSPLHAFPESESDSAFWGSWRWLRVIHERERNICRLPGRQDISHWGLPRWLEPWRQTRWGMWLINETKLVQIFEADLNWS